MYLKNLTVLGFKSFADKTSMNFQPGVTAIVGPNGCGKSNVSDAIRWVLGEQSAKALRGGEMADVIFNGTDSRKPLGMAEVSLTIGGVDEEHLKAAGVEMAYDEVTVTRRVFRDGGSEYFINKTGCRLKDIQQLFMGTGVGRTSYSIMAQGNITQILSSKPEERRLVFEEAAGITKFKAQKKESLRKLEYTEQNLLRVADLIREVKRQIGSLQRQAGKARRYKQIMVELQHLETQLLRHQFDLLQEEISARQASAEKARLEMEICSESVLRCEDEILQLRERLSELEHRIAELQQRGMELKGQSERHESRIQFNEERLRELEQQNARAIAEVAQSEERKLAAEQELTSVTERLESATTSLQAQRTQLEEKRQAVQRLEQETAALQEQLRMAQSEAFGAAQQLARGRNEINALDLRKEGNLVRLEKLRSEKVQLEEERSRLENVLAEFTRNVEAEKLNVQTQRGTVEERQARLRALQQEVALASQELDALVRQQAEKKSRLNVLEQLDTSHEGFSSGALAALKQSSAVLGTLADRLRVPDQYVTAVETALGQHLQLVLTEQPEAAEQILSDLRSNRKGRASIASLDLLAGLESGDQTADAAHTWEGVRALDIIQADPLVEPLLRGLLGRTWIVADLPTAARAWRESGGHYDFVTDTGDLLSRQGVFTGGTGNGNGQPAASILGRKNQIAELHAQIGKLQEQADEKSRGKGALQGEQTELQASLQQAQTDLRAQEVAIATRQGEFKALENSQRALHHKHQTVTYELDNLTAQEAEGTRKREALFQQVNDLAATEEAAQIRVTDLTAALEQSRGARDAANALLTEAKVTFASEEQVCAALTRQKGPLEQRIRELTHLLEQRHQEMGGFSTRQGQFLADIEESRRQIERLQGEREVVSGQTAELVAQRQELEGNINEREENLRGQRRRLTDLQQQRATLDVELAQKTMSVQNLRDRVQEKYQLNLEDVRSECITITIADEGPAQVETLSPGEMAAGGAATDWAAVAEQVSVLQKRIDEMGPVNLVAIEEYEETEQRFQFLSTQHDDLVKAKAQLMEVINRINTQTREMFQETFNRIRDNFRAMFTEIFGGGKADLVLVNEGDVLESGIDIMARPPGKQLQSITLLSGGEQTMTAVALLFSIYQVKPSPFCVLDELDAPLDESNINRFIRVLQRFLAHSQFIIITHNKRTIGMADVLYGVTMQEHGISRIVSVKFHKADAEGPTTSNTLLVPPPAGSTVDAAEDRLQKTEDTMEMAMGK